MAVAAITTAAAGRSTTTAAAVAKKLACLSEQVGAARKFLRAARSSCNRQLQSIMARTRFKGEEALACRSPGAPAAECSIKYLCAAKRRLLGCRQSGRCHFTEGYTSRLRPCAASAPCKESLAPQGFSLAPHRSLLAVESQGLRPLTILERLFRQAGAAKQSTHANIFTEIFLFQLLALKYLPK